MATKTRIDDVLENLFQPFYIHASTSWMDYLYNLDDSLCRKVLFAVGLKIPRQCWFKKTFNLSWTPCKLNPFFEHLIELSCWAHNEESQAFLKELYTDLGVNPYGSEED